MADIMIAFGVGLTLGVFIGVFAGMCITALVAMARREDEQQR